MWKHLTFHRFACRSKSILFFLFSPEFQEKEKKNIHRLLDREGGLTRKALNNHTMIEKVLRVWIFVSNHVEASPTVVFPFTARGFRKRKKNRKNSYLPLHGQGRGGGGTNYTGGVEMLDLNRRDVPDRMIRERERIFLDFFCVYLHFLLLCLSLSDDALTMQHHNNIEASWWKEEERAAPLIWDDSLFFFSIPPRLPSVVSCPGIYNISDEDKKQTKEECLVLLQQSLIFFLPLMFSTTTITTTPHMKKKTCSFVVVSFSSAALRRALVTKLCQTSRWRWKPVERDARH